MKGHFLCLPFRLTVFILPRHYKSSLPLENSRLKAYQISERSFDNPAFSTTLLLNLQLALPNYPITPSVSSYIASFQASSTMSMYFANPPLVNPNQLNMQVLNNNNRYCAHCAALLTNPSSVYCDDHRYMQQSIPASQQPAPEMRNPELVLADYLCHATQYGLNDHFINGLGHQLEKYGVDRSNCTVVVGIAVGSCKTQTTITFTEGKIQKVPYLVIGRDAK